LKRISWIGLDSQGILSLIMPKPSILPKWYIFFQNYNKHLGHSTYHYPQGNGLVESSNKILIRIINNMLSQNKNAQYFHLKYAVWEDRFIPKRYIGTSPFHLLYVLEAIFSINLSLPMMKLLQYEEEESDGMQRRIIQLIEV
jgi:hypothetical protein